MKVLFLKGIQASGKTTFAIEKCKKDKNWVRVNRDSLRFMRGEYWIPKQEKMISKWEKECILAALVADKNVIVDAMNLNENHVNSIKNFIEEKIDTEVMKITFDTKIFHLPLEECIKRDLARANSIGAEVITKTYNKYFPTKKVTYVEAIELQKCIIVDIDGTLAINNSGRSMYATDASVIKDDVNYTIRDIVKRFRRLTPVHKIIIFSGRKDICREYTRKWLEDNEVPYDYLYMRGADDNRKDSIVKKEMFEEHIRGKYYCEFVLDDRNQVVDMWRNELGLICLQVAEGNF